MCLRADFYFDWSNLTFLMTSPSTLWSHHFDKLELGPPSTLTSDNIIVCLCSCCIRVLVFMLHTCACVHAAYVCLCSCCVRVLVFMLCTCACVHVVGFLASHSYLFVYISYDSPMAVCSLLPFSDKRAWPTILWKLIFCIIMLFPMKCNLSPLIQVALLCRSLDIKRDKGCNPHSSAYIVWNIGVRGIRLV